MILDAMMPSAPISVANPGMPPQGLLQAADRVRWLEQLRESGLITSDEYARERTAIEGHISPAAPKIKTKPSATTSSATQATEANAEESGDPPSKTA